MIEITTKLFGKIVAELIHVTGCHGCEAQLTAV